MKFSAIVDEVFRRAEEAREAEHQRQDAEPARAPKVKPGGGASFASFRLSEVRENEPEPGVEPETDLGTLAGEPRGER